VVSATGIFIEDMCGRYSFDKVDEFGERFGIDFDPKEVRPNFNVAPTQTMPVIRNVDGLKTVELMRWGIPRFIGPGKVKDVFNTRSDKAFHNWKKMTMTQRILVPATGFYEWKKLAGGKQPYFIHTKDEDMFAFAGIWNAWKDEDGKIINTYSIITTEPNKEMTEIHNRMPVILHRDEEDAWLDPSHDNDEDALGEYLIPSEDNRLEMYEVSKDVNTAKVNDAKLIKPLNSQ